MTDDAQRGTRVLVPPGTYRVGVGVNFNLTLARTAVGTVDFTFQERRFLGRVTMARVSLDDDSLPNPDAPATVMVDAAALRVIDLADLLGGGQTAEDP